MMTMVEVGRVINQSKVIFSIQNLILKYVRSKIKKPPIQEAFLGEIK